MTIVDSIKAMPTIADANGDLCVSQAAVLALIEAKAEEWYGHIENRHNPQHSAENCDSCIQLEECASQLSASRPAAGS